MNRVKDPVGVEKNKNQAETEKKPMVDYCEVEIDWEAKIADGEKRTEHEGRDTICLWVYDNFTMVVIPFALGIGTSYLLLGTNAKVLQLFVANLRDKMTETSFYSVVTDITKEYITPELFSH